MKFNSKFETLLEDVLWRYQLGGLLNGDLVKFRKDALKNEKVKEMTQSMQEMIKNAIETDLNLRVSAIKSIRPSSTNVMNNIDAPADHYVDICVEYAPGLWKDPMTVPVGLLERIDPTPNLAPVPDSLKRKDTTQANPNTGRKQENDPDRTKVLDANRNLTAKNTTLPHSNKWNDKKPGAGNLPKKK